MSTVVLSTALPSSSYRGFRCRANLRRLYTRRRAIDGRGMVAQRGLRLCGNLREADEDCVLLLLLFSFFETPRFFFAPLFFAFDRRGFYAPAGVYLGVP